MSRVSESLKGQLLCSAAMVLVGSTVVVSKVIGTDVEPFLATALRHAIALPIFWLLMRAADVRFPRVNRHDAALLLVQAAAGSVGYTVLLIHGVVLAGAAETSVVTGTLPAVSALFAVVFLRERPGWRLACAIALATAGVVVVTLSPAPLSAGPARLQGIALVLAAITCESAFILANKRLSQPIPALALSALMCAGGLLLSALPAWFHGRPHRPFSPPLPCWALPTTPWCPRWVAFCCGTPGVPAPPAHALRWPRCGCRSTHFYCRRCFCTRRLGHGSGWAWPA